MTANQVQEQYQDISVDLDNGYVKKVNFVDGTIDFPSLDQDWLVPIDENTFQGKFEKFSGCVHSPDYSYSVPFVGKTKGAMKLCATASWYVVL